MTDTDAFNRSLTAGGHVPARRAKAPGWRERLLLARLQHLRAGRLSVRLPSGTVYSFEGVAPGPAAHLDVHRPRLITRLAFSGNLGLAEGYLAGDWDSPDLKTLLMLGAANAGALSELMGGTRLAGLANRIAHRRRANTRPGSRRNIAQHYDLGNDFYGHWLDPGMTYSSALFDRMDEPMEVGQRRKYLRLDEKLDLRPGDRVLEIGCGWGGFAIWCAQRYGCRVTGLTLSTEQLAEAQARAEAAGVADRVSFRLEDYRDHRGVYDRIASIEMYEAVGERHWPGYFRAVHDALVPGGRAAVQGITIAPEIFESYRRKRDFIQKHVFPGGMLCPPERFRALAADAGLESRDARFYAGDYARTLAIWHRNVLACADRVTEQFDARFLRMWRYYLAYCECGFLTGSIDLMQITLLRRA